MYRTSVHISSRNYGRLLGLLLVLLCPSGLQAQSLAVKTNLLYDALLVPSLGVECVVSPRGSVNLTGTYAPFDVGDRKWRNWSVSPEYRLWLHHALTGPFFGVNAIVGGFNINNVHVGGLYGKQRQGTMAGGGLSAGWHFILSSRLSVEAVVGGDWLSCRYDHVVDGSSEGRFTSSVVLPLGTGINIVYILK